jgi:endo-1,4-beta-xylanase
MKLTNTEIFKSIARRGAALFLLTLPLFGHAQTATYSETPTLRNLATPLGFTIGAGSLDNPPGTLSDSTYTGLVAAQYNAVEPGNSMKMDALEPEQGTFDFSGGDAVAAFAQAHTQTVTATAPIWDGKATDYGTGNPTWLMNGNFTTAQLQAILQTYVTTIMQHYHSQYPGIVTNWALVSEASHLCGVLCTTMGNDSSGYPAYIALAYTYARAADPSAKLCYDDWGGEGSGATSDWIYGLVSYLKGKGLIDCVGLEGQWEGTGGIANIPATSAIVTNINRLGALGVSVYFSQVEISVASSDGTTADNPSDLTTQGNEYGALMQACLSTAACKGFYTWNITDKYAFCFDAGWCAPLPFDVNEAPKPAYNAIQSALAASPTTSQSAPAAPTNLKGVVSGAS